MMLALAGVCATLSAPARAAEKAAEPADVTFNRSIRPILSDRCFACHGPDSTKRKADLRFDRKSSAFDPIPKDPHLRPFVPGKPEQSEAYRRVTSTDSEVVMPPAKSHLKVSAHEKELLRKWIEQGAKWEEYWAFIKPVRPEAPTVKDAKWARNDIDRFILARLEAEGLHPTAEADKAMLIRRVSLDLTGLPPTPAEVDAFVADQSPDAYEKVVDRLLASPHYGEQMALPWLDYARYADSHGYQSDPERHMWRWRDWVINAYNKNMPFDQFTIEQIAGDLLPNPTTDQKIATGFNRNHRINAEGGVIAEEWRVEGVVDRVETTGEVWLGLTLGCCRCHDHKFDPITQKDFYSFSGFFNSINETGTGDTGFTDKGHNVPPLLKLPTPEQSRQIAALNAKIATAKKELAALDAKFPQLLAEWEKKGGAASDPDGLIARYTFNGTLDGRAEAGKDLQAELGGNEEPTWGKGQLGKALLFSRTTSVNTDQCVHREPTEPFTISCWIKMMKPGAIVAKTAGGHGYQLSIAARSDALDVWLGNSATNRIEIASAKPLPLKKWVHLAVTYDGSKKAEGLKIYLNGAADRAKITRNALSAEMSHLDPLTFVIGKHEKTESFEGLLEDLMILGRIVEADEAKQLADRPAVDVALKIAADRRSDGQKKKIEDYFRACSPTYGKTAGQVATSERRLKEFDAEIPDTMIMEELPKPRDNFVLIRGQYDKHGEKVPTGLPAVLPPLPAGAEMNRLGLAKWIVDPSNPLTARVQVNRLWEKFFTIGIVKTSENLGTQADAPSNPALLDWLATEFIRRHWDLKAMQKLIVTSAAYRQASTVTPELLERDPENRLIARGSRVRLPAESIRDQALAVSGLLVDKIGGPSVKPYEPANLWEGNRFGNLAKYVQDKGEGLYRRSLYMFWKRTANPPNMTVFDMPSREYCVLKRSRTDTPLQALDLMNDPTYLEASRVLAEHMMQDGGSTPVDRITYAFHRATCRNPTGVELRILLGGFKKQLDRYREDPKAAETFVSVGDWPRDAKLDVSELAAYTMTCSVILNLDEMVNKP
jgi:hypothetical protein